MAPVPDQHVDALVVGAGFSGIHQLNEFLKLGLSVKVIDLASDIGGTWHFNCYPGAMSDTESFVYRYSWDKEDLQTYPWKNHYVHQPEVLEYLHHIVDKYDLRKHMQFNTEMLSADWDDDAQVWRVVTSTGETILARYLVAALGVLSKRNIPDIPGASTFKGQLTHSASWSPDIDVRNKRVGVIGNGSTGVQIITDIAPKVSSLTCFQRHPQYSVPSGNKPVAPEYRQWVNSNYDAIWDQVRHSAVGFGFEESTRSVFSVPPAERAAIFEQLWARGNGFRFMFEGFGDIAVSPAANEEACAFIRQKIAATVTDPATAAKLTPREPLARRPICDNGYFAQFNRPHVSLVDLQATPIDAITPGGIRTRDGAQHDLDVIVFATGFDAVDGNYTRIVLRDRHGVALKDRWAAGPSSYLGVFAGDCPNLFMVNGPQAPFCNNPPAFEAAVALITACVRRAEDARRETGRGALVEVTMEAERGWAELCETVAKDSLFRQPHSWIFGANIPGKPLSCRFYFAGLKSYLEYVDGVVKDGWRGFKPFEVQGKGEEKGEAAGGGPVLPELPKSSPIVL